MSITKSKSDPWAAEEIRGQVRPENPHPVPTEERREPDEKVFSELLTKGTEEIQDHLSLVARIQVQIGRLLETSIEELERAQRLETLTSLIGGIGSEKDDRGSENDAFAESQREGPVAYLGREIKNLKKMQKLLGKRAPPGEETGLPPPELPQVLSAEAAVEEPEAGRRILIIYHDPATVRILRYFLEKEDYEVIVCSNGPDGLQRAVQERPDLILLDILLSGMDGYQVLSRLKKNIKTVQIPVFVLSVLVQENDILKAIEGGAADYFTKPFSPLIVVAKIKRALKARHE